MGPVKWRTTEEDGNLVHLLDDAAIRYLMEGLEQLLMLEPGQQIETPSFEEDEQGIPTSASMVVFRKVA